MTRTISPRDTAHAEWDDLDRAVSDLPDPDPTWTVVAHLLANLSASVRGVAIPVQRRGEAR